MDTTTVSPAPSPVAPHTLAPLFDNIPAELRALKQWVVWAHTWKEAEQKFAKVPSTSVTGGPASSTDPATWGTFDEAVAAYTASRAKGDPNDALDGVGFVFTGTPYMGVNQDHVLADGVLAPEAARIVAELGTYTEISPSGTGVKSFVKAKKPGNGWSKITGRGLEMYDSGRYFTMTGHHLADTPTAPQPRQPQVDALYRRVLSEKEKPAPKPVATVTQVTPSMSDDELVKKIVGSAQGGKFMRLYAGLTDQYGGDESGADMALAGVLAFWIQDAEQIERVMRKSGLVRAKWDERRLGGTYLSVTIEKVLESVTETYGTKPASHDLLGLVPLNTIAMKPVPWLWPGYLPLGATSLFVGDPGNGKTLSGLDLLARITVGAAWPDGTLNTFGPRNVIVLSAEDANEYTIRPRIEAAGGDCARVFVIPADKAGKLSLDTDVERLRLAIEKYQPLAVMIDPLSAYMPGIDSYRDNEVRSSLARFVAILAELNVAAIAIVHMSKNIERNAMQRVLGSTAFTALSRSTFMISRDPDAHEGDDTRRLFLALKFNLGRTPEGHAFRIVGKTVKGDGVVVEAPVAEWDTDTVKANADEVLRQLQRPADARRELQEAMLAVVKDGPVTQKEAKEALARFGKSDDALLAQRKKVGIETMRDPADAWKGEYYWLPPKLDPKAREAWTQERMALRQPPKPAA